MRINNIFVFFYVINFYKLEFAMIINFIKIVSVLFICSSFPLFALESELNGFGNSKWGMTADEVFSSENGNVVLLKKPLVFNKTVGLVQRDKIDISIYKFSAIYQFNSESKKLQQVVLKPIDNKYSYDVFESVESKLIIKYGQPAYRKALQRTEYKSIGKWTEDAKSVWRIGETEISILYFDTKEKSGYLSLAYTQISSLTEDVL